jgi:hypothetical protein
MDEVLAAEGWRKAGTLLKRNDEYGVPVTPFHATLYVCYLVLGDKHTTSVLRSIQR